MRRAASALVVVALLGGAACGDDDAAVQVEVDEPPGDAAAFCDAWVTAQSDDDLFAALDLAPEELHEPAALLRDARDEERTEQDSDAVDELNDWVADRCHPEVALPDATGGDRRVAPVRADLPDELRFCLASTLPPSSSADGRLVLYGDTAQGDPYDSPMLGLAWNPVGEGTHEGDGDATPVTVRGGDGVVAPITVFQQTIPDGLGIVVAWEEDGRAVGLYGRHWDPARSAELVAVADAIVVEGEDLRLPLDALPAGFGEVYSGAPDPLSLVWMRGSYLMALKTERPAGDDVAPVLTLTGREGSQEELEAMRFFGTGLGHATVADRAVLEGAAWGVDGPSVVAWREPDGLLVQVVGIGVDLDLVRAVASASRELSREEWLALATSESECLDPRPGR